MRNCYHFLKAIKSNFTKRGVNFEKSKICGRISPFQWRVADVYPIRGSRDIVVLVNLTQKSLVKQVQFYFRLFRTKYSHSRCNCTFNFAKFISLYYLPLLTLCLRFVFCIVLIRMLFDFLKADTKGFDWDSTSRLHITIWAAPQATYQRAL